MNRRDLLRKAAASGAAIAAEGLLIRGAAAEAASRPAETSGAKLPLRSYGRKGVQISVLGFPGFALKDVPEDEVKRALAMSIERGITYFDVAPTYGDAQQRLGPALEPYRKGVFLACKTTERTAAGAKKELQNSLKVLRTDHFDLYQLHAITTMADVDTAFGKGGAMETFLEARKEGIVRHIGFSAHSIEAAVAAMDRYDFDSALVPMNFASWHTGGFGPQIVEAAAKKGVTLLALKAMARQKWPKNDPQKSKFPRCWYQPTTDRHEAELCLRFTLSQPVAAAIPPADLSLLPMAIDIASKFRPLEPEGLAELKRAAAAWDPVFRKA